MRWWPLGMGGAPTLADLPPPPQNFRLVSSEQALKELGLAEHQLRFTCRVHLHDTRKEQETAMRVYSHLKRWASVPPALWVGHERARAGGSLCLPAVSSRTTVSSTFLMAP